VKRCGTGDGFGQPVGLNFGAICVARVQAVICVYQHMIVIKEKIFIVRNQKY